MFTCSMFFAIFSDYMERVNEQSEKTGMEEHECESRFLCETRKQNKHLKMALGVEHVNTAMSGPFLSCF